MLKTVPLSSLHRVYPDFCPEDMAKNSFSLFSNETLNFQVAFKSDSGAVNINLRIDSDLPISYHYVSAIPIIHPHSVGLEFPDTHPVQYDILLPKKINPILKEEGFRWQTIWFEKGEDKIVNAVSDAWQTLWFSVNENSKSLKAGKHTITLSFLSGHTNEEIAREEITLQVMPEKLVPQTLFCTNWFHCDCVADAHKVEVFSDEFFTALYNYAHKAAINGQNMILTPCFTPPLDTPVGGERKTVQLVKIEVLGKNKYRFDFSLLKKYIETCKRAGIKHFEINHLFTQWGAKATPKIVATVGGKEKRIFGWDTPASGEKYRKFLRAFLTELTAFLKAEGLQKRVLFHISDEPLEENVMGYGSAVKNVADLLDGFMVGDALSCYEIYQKGYTKIPIVATDHIDAFRGKCKNYWCYYTGEQVKGLMSNRLPTVSAERNRMLGVQMYAYGVKGFLHWGYNYYYDVLSHGFLNPTLDPSVYRTTPGTSYFVYPAEGLDCYQSVRQKIFAEGVTDMRALRTLEKLKGRQVAENLIKKHFGEVSFETGPESPEQYLAFREELNAVVSGQA